jgi:putative copper export protein
MLALEGLVSAALYFMSALVLGSLATAAFVLPPGKTPLRQKLLSFAALFTAGFLLIAAAALVVQGAKLSGGALPSLDILGRYLMKTQSGNVWLWRELYGALLLALLVSFQKTGLSERAGRWMVLAAMPLAASRSLASHAAAAREYPLAAMACDAIHLIVAALWAGGLPLLCWALWRSSRLNTPPGWTGNLVARFSRLAFWSVALLVATGLYQSWIQLGTWNSLLETAYGRILLLKLALFLMMLGFGALNRLFTLPDLIAAPHPAPFPREAFQRIGAEAALAVVVFVVTGFLTILPPGAHSGHQFAASRRPGALQPGDGAMIKILSPREGETFRSDEVPITFRLTPGRRGEHAHAYVDGELMGMFESESGTLTGITPGHHKLELRVVAEDHQTELDASDAVHFVVK